jgi:hypothetical protein
MEARFQPDSSPSFSLRRKTPPPSFFETEPSLLEHSTPSTWTHERDHQGRRPVLLRLPCCVACFPLRSWACLLILTPASLPTGVSTQMPSPQLKRSVNHHSESLSVKLGPCPDLACLVYIREGERRRLHHQDDQRQDDDDRASRSSTRCSPRESTRQEGHELQRSSFSSCPFLSLFTLGSIL